MYTAQGPAHRNGATTYAIIGVIILAFGVMPTFPAQGATLSAISSAGLRDNAPEDGIADAIGSTLWVYNISTATAVAVMEYNVSAFTGQSLSVATVQGKLFVNNSNDRGVRTFLVKVYAGNGSTELDDYAIEATEVGQFFYSPPTDHDVEFSIDMLDVATSLIENGATYLGVRVEPAGPDSPNVFSSAPTITLQTGNPPGPKAIAWTVDPINFAQSSTGVDGTEFTPQEPITVTALGYYDDTFVSGPGLSVPHDVGIYDLVTFDLVVSAEVPAGDQVALVDVFRIIEITPTDLVAGRTYVLAAVSEGDYGRVAAPASLAVDPRITMEAWRVGAGSTLSLPGSVVPTENFFLGPTFLFTAEPSGDADGDGVVDGLDECPNTIPEVKVDEVGCPPLVNGDFDRDGDVDLDDYGIFEQCMSGADTPADPDCGN